MQHSNLKPERKSLFIRPNLRWEKNINIGFRKICCEGMDYIKLAQDRIQWRVFVKSIFGFHERRELLNHLNNYQVLKEYSALQS
jgi:hypothetical protein